MNRRLMLKLTEDDIEESYADCRAMRTPSPPEDDLQSTSTSSKQFRTAP